MDQASGITQLMQDLMLAASLLEEEIHQEMEVTLEEMDNVGVVVYLPVHSWRVESKQNTMRESLLVRMG